MKNIKFYLKSALLTLPLLSTPFSYGMEKDNEEKSPLEKLPVEIIDMNSAVQAISLNTDIIANEIDRWSDFKTQINIRSTCHFFHTGLTNFKFEGPLSQQILPRSDINQRLLRFPYLTSLDLSNNSTITNETVRQLTNLKSLGLRFNYTIINETVSQLTNLESLDLCRNSLILNWGITNLTNLKSLGLSGNQNITNWGITNLTNLKSLDISNNQNIKIEDIENLKNLTSLDITWNKNIPYNKILSLQKKLIELRW